MSDRDRRRSQRGSFYGDKRPSGYEPRRSRRDEADQKRTESGGKPVEAGKEYKVRIIDRSERGEGVARIEGFIVFVRGAKPGEEVRIKVTNVGARAATGELIVETAPVATAESTPTPSETPPTAETPPPS
ncbi:MAG: TRAM domain-containing protein [Nitrososphaerota archaeon]|nr:TRAM domain-containing protein [Nitrososphaerota archaeon]MDG6924167.1 TRAM domain-containing protein [Nitrososphaerota archaeon]